MTSVPALIAEALRAAQCRDARVAWARRRSDEWLAAHREVDDLLMKAVERLSEEAFERLCERELGRVDAMMRELRAALDEDKWPRECHVGGL